MKVCSSGALLLTLTLAALSFCRAAEARRVFHVRGHEHGGSGVVKIPIQRVKSDKWRIIEERLTGMAARNPDGSFVEKLGQVPMQNSQDVSRGKGKVTVDCKLTIHT